DQRGCGRSTPSFGVENNRLPDLIDDARRILDALGIDRCDLYGGSWGSTVALVFAQAFADRVRRLMVTKTFLARRKDVEWMTQDTARLYPDIMARIASAVPPGMETRAYYAGLALSGDPEKRA